MRALSFRASRQPYFEAGALVHFAGHSDRATMRLHDSLRDGQAKAAAAIGSRFVGAIEPFEEIGKLVRRDSFSGIGDAYYHRAVLCQYVHAHISLVAIVMNRIGKEICNHLSESFRVTVAFHVGQIALDVNAALYGQRQNFLDAFFDQVGKAERGSLHLLLSSIEP